MASNQTEIEIDLELPGIKVRQPHIAIMILCIGIFLLSFFPSVVSMILVIIAWIEIFYIFGCINRELGYLERSKDLLDDFGSVLNGVPRGKKLKLLDILRQNIPIRIQQETLNETFARIPNGTSITKNIGGDYIAVYYPDIDSRPITGNGKVPSIALAKMEEKLEKISSFK